MKKYHTEKSEEIFSILSKYFNVQYDDAGNIGKRYRRQDAIGTPYCVTIDEDTLNQGTVTVRDRDSMSQIKVHMDELKSYFEKQFE